MVGNLKIAPLSADERTTASGLYNTAASFLSAARALDRARVKSTHPLSPVVFLYGHSIELFLKSYLRLQGLTVREIRSIGHKVTTLAERSTSAGLSFDDADADTIELIASGDTIMRARYIETGPFRWPSVGELDGTGQSLRDKVRTALRLAGHRVR